MASGASGTGVSLFFGLAILLGCLGLATCCSSALFSPLASWRPVVTVLLVERPG